MFKSKGASSRQSDLEIENKQLKYKTETLERENAELRKQLLDVQSRLTVYEQVTAATQQRELIQEGVSLPTGSVYEKLRFDPTQEEHVYAKPQPPGNKIYKHFR